MRSRHNRMESHSEDRRGVLWQKTGVPENEPCRLGQAANAGFIGARCNVFELSQNGWLRDEHSCINSSFIRKPNNMKH